MPIPYLHKYRTRSYKKRYKAQQSALYAEGSRNNALRNIGVGEGIAAEREASHKKKFNEIMQNSKKSRKNELNRKISAANSTVKRHCASKNRLANAAGSKCAIMGGKTRKHRTYKLK